MKWVIALAVLFLYVHLFNAVAKLYFDSDYTLTLGDLWHRVVPPMDFHIRI